MSEKIVSSQDKIRQIMLCIIALCLVAVLACLNRKFPPAILKLQLIDVFRITDLLAMLLFSPLALFFLWKLLRIYEGNKIPWISFIFILGAFLLGCGFGMHDPFNVFTMKYGREIPEKIYGSIIFLDDYLGHWLFFAGFMLVSLSACFAELENPVELNFPLSFVAGFSIAAFMVALGIFKNMIKEETVTDIVILLACSACAFGFQLFKKQKNFLRLPCNLALHIAYAGGAILTIAYWILF